MYTDLALYSLYSIFYKNNTKKKFKSNIMLVVNKYFIVYSDAQIYLYIYCA